MNMPTTPTRLAPEVREAVMVFLKSYDHSNGPFAISEAMNAVRRVYPAMDVSDNELTSAIAEEAVTAGLDIHFDGNGNSKRTSETDNWENEGGASSA